MDGENRRGGGGRGRGGGGRGYQGGDGGGGGRGRGRGGYNQPPFQQQQYQQGRGRAYGQGYGGDQRVPYQSVQGSMENLNLGGGDPVRAPFQQQYRGGGGGGAWGGPQRPYGGAAQGPGPSRGPGNWSGRPRGPSPSFSSPSPSSQGYGGGSQVAIPEIPPVAAETGARASLKDICEKKHKPINRPDKGGTIARNRINLLVNHFPVTFDPNMMIMHYDVDVKQDKSANEPVKKMISKADRALIRRKVFADNPDGFPVDMSVYDGEKNIFSMVALPTGEFKVVLSGDESKTRSYVFTIKLVAELSLSKLKEYLSGTLTNMPREILQAMDLVMKDNPSKCGISVGRHFFSKKPFEDLGYGVAAHRGFQQSLRPTSQGLALCLDYSVLAFRKPYPVLQFLQEYIPDFRVDQFQRYTRQVEDALRGLKVNVIHRKTKQKFVISTLSKKKTRDETFVLEDLDGNEPPREVHLVDYFQEKWGVEVVHKDIPCLDLGKKGLVPMEFCILIEGQIFPKENLDRDTGIFLKKLSLPPPGERRARISDMVEAKANDGPCGEVSRKFGIGVEQYMTPLVGRVLPPPALTLGGSNRVPINDRAQWNLVGKTVVKGTPVERWALVDFTTRERRNRLNEGFIPKLRDRSQRMGIPMEDPLVYYESSMRDLSSVQMVEKIFKQVVEMASKKSQGKLQMIVCAMADKHDGYKNIKWVSETKIGVVTQCFLSGVFNKGRDQDLANLCKKINAKLGGSNFELVGRLPHFNGQEHVMFIGADVNHPAARNVMCPSIAAVVGTVNWPASNRYAARVCPQNHRTEKIINFGSICADLINTYAKINRVRPARIVIFRDGVSEGQFEMVLNEELIDFMRSVYSDDYQPPVTFVVAQKRHHTRLFLENGALTENVPPGTVVDTKVVHPFEFDFYLNSHFGGLGTSKPTHYYVLWDENRFTSDSLQKLIFDLCFTYARCAKAVSLVPPVYYADLVAYRGRMFQEVIRDNEPARSSASIASASFQHEFYKAHQDLKDSMFFV